MRATPLLFVTIAFPMVAFTPAFGQNEDDRDLVIFYCSRCHAADQYYLADRSEKAWHLVVKRMQDNQYEEEGVFNDEEAARIVTYLAAHPYNTADYKPRPRPSAEPIVEAEPTVAAMVSAPAPEAIADQPPAPASTPTDIAAPPPVPASAPGVLADRPFTPAQLAAKAKLAAARLSPAKATGLAKVMGYIAVAALALMVITGLIRNKIGQVFRKTHGVLAFVFCGSLTVHAAVFLAEYGAPGVLWLWFGIIATVILLSSEFTGLLHLQNRKLFIKYHVAAGVAGLTLTAAHWAWIYI